MSSFLFILGRKADLCFAEAEQVLLARFPDSNPTRVQEHVVEAQLETIEQARMLQSILGGTMKIAKTVAKVPNVSTEKIEEGIADVVESLLPEGAKKITFGLGEFGRESLDAVSHTQVKKYLKERGISSRFIDAVRSGLSASVLLHQDVDEVLVVKTGIDIYFSYTIAVQNIDDWTRRDRSKPGVDRKRGMLPPKLARTMVNLAVPGSEKKRILDPFCGTGTVLMESLMLGHEALGSDIRLDAVKHTRENITWFQTVYPGTYTYDAFMADATQLTEEVLHGKVDAIVAEGFLGPVMPEAKDLPNIFKGLEKLYTGSLRQWRHILSPGARICLALPQVEIGHKIYSLKDLIDRSGDLGYNTLLSPMIYDRPEAVVKREIFVLEYKAQ